jgi:hypothetical protein
VRSLKFSQGLPQVSSRTAAGSACRSKSAAIAVANYANLGRTADGNLVPVLIEFLRRSDAAQSQGLTARIHARRIPNSFEITLLNFAAGLVQRFRFGLNRHKYAT